MNSELVMLMVLFELTGSARLVPVFRRICRRPYFGSVFSRRVRSMLARALSASASALRVEQASEFLGQRPPKVGPGV